MKAGADLTPQSQAEDQKWQKVVTAEIQKQIANPEMSPLMYRLLVFFLITVSVFLSLTPDKDGNIPAAEPLLEVGLLCLQNIAEYSTIEDFLNQNLINDEAYQSTVEQFQEITDTESNPYYQGMLETVQEGVDFYNAQHPESEAYWTPPPDINEISDLDLISILSEPITQEEYNNFTGFLSLIQDPNVSIEVGTIPLTLIPLVIQAQNTEYEPGVERGVSIYLGALVNSRIGDLNPEIGRLLYGAQMGHRPISGLFADLIIRASHPFAPPEAMFGVYATVREDIERISEAEFNSEPVPLWRIYAYFLERTNGDVTQTNREMLSFFKISVRGQRSTMVEKQYQWIIENVQDSFNQDFSWNGIDDFSALPEEEQDAVTSLFGITYHAFDYIHLTDRGIPTTLLYIGTGQEYARYNHLAEPVKIESDRNVLRETRELNDYFRTLPDSPQTSENALE